MVQTPDPRNLSDQLDPTMVQDDPLEIMDPPDQSDPLDSSVISDDEEDDSFCEMMSLANWLDEYTSEEIRNEQMKDPDLEPIISWLEESHDPKDNILFGHSPATKSLWLCRDRLKFKEGVLFYEWKCLDTLVLKLVVPRTLQDLVLKFSHDARCGGHFGISKTQARLRESVMWYNMTTQAKVYVQACSICNLNKKANRKAKCKLGTYYAGYPMERVHIDILGPLMTSNAGNSYVLVIIDQFTKWIDCVALPDQKAERLAYEFLSRFVVNFGCPVEIHTDQAKNLDGNVFRAFCELLEITKTRTTPYHPASNGQVERYNRVILQMIRCYLNKNNRDWDYHLPWLVGALHSTEHRQTGFTPNKMMLGREVLKPLDILLGLHRTKFNVTNPPDWVIQLEKSMIAAHTMAREFLHSSQRRQKRDYDLHLKESRYEIGDMVYRLDEATVVGVSSKLRPPWQGPYVVVARNPPLYDIKGQKTAKTMHHDKLKLCTDGFIPMWARRERHKLIPNVEVPETDANTGRDLVVEVHQVPEMDTIEEMVEEADQSDTGRDLVQRDVDGADQSDTGRDLVQKDGDEADQPRIKKKTVVKKPKRDTFIPWLDDDDLPRVFDQPVCTKRGRLVKKPYKMKDYVL